MKTSWGTALIIAAALAIPLSFGTGCQPEPTVSAKTPEAKNKFLGTGPSPEEQTKMRELQARAMKNSSGPSSAQLEAMKKRPAKP